MPLLSDWNKISSSPEYWEFSPTDRMHAKAQWFKENIAPTPEFNELNENDKVRLLNHWVNTPDEQSKPETSMIKEAGKGLLSGVMALPESIGSLLEYTSVDKSTEGVREFGKTAKDFWQRQQEKVSANVPDMTGIKNTGDFFNWASWNTMQMVGQMATTLPFMGGAAGAKEGVATGGKVLVDLIKTKPGAVSQAAKFLGEWIAPKAIDIPIGILEAGQITSGQTEAIKKGEIRKEDPLRAFAAAFIATKFESLGAEGTVNRLISGTSEATGKLIKRVVSGALATGVGEGTEEFFQQYAEQFGINPKDTASKENFMQSVNAAGAGFIGGLFMGGGSAAFNTQERQERAKKNQDFAPILGDIQKKYSSGAMSESDLRSFQDTYQDNSIIFNGINSILQKEKKAADIQNISTATNVDDAVNAFNEATKPGVTPQFKGGLLSSQAEQPEEGFIDYAKQFPNYDSFMEGISDPVTKNEIYKKYGTEIKQLRRDNPDFKTWFESVIQPISTEPTINRQAPTRSTVREVQNAKESGTQTGEGLLQKGIEGQGQTEANLQITQEPGRIATHETITPSLPPTETSETPDLLTTHTESSIGNQASPKAKDLTTSADSFHDQGYYPDLKPEVKAEKGGEAKKVFHQSDTGELKLGKDIYGLGEGYFVSSKKLPKGFYGKKDILLSLKPETKLFDFQSWAKENNKKLRVPPEERAGIIKEATDIAKKEGYDGIEIMPDDIWVFKKDSFAATPTAPTVEKPTSPEAATVQIGEKTGEGKGEGTEKPDIDVLDLMADDILNTKGNERGDYGKDTTHNIGSSNPEWFKKLNALVEFENNNGTKIVKYKGISRDTFFAIQKKIKEKGYDSLTEIQKRYYFFIKQVMPDFTAQSYEIKAMDDLAFMEKEGYEPVGGEEVVVGNLNKGDKVLIRGEEFEHKGEDKDGDVILEDGVPIKADLFDKIRIDGIKRAEKAETETTTDLAEFGRIPSSEIQPVTPQEPSSGISPTVEKGTPKTATPEIEKFAAKKSEERTALVNLAKSFKPGDKVSFTNGNGDIVSAQVTERQTGAVGQDYRDQGKERIISDAGTHAIDADKLIKPKEKKSHAETEYETKPEKSALLGKKTKSFTSDNKENEVGDRRSESGEREAPERTGTGKETGKISEAKSGYQLKEPSAQLTLEFKKAEPFEPVQDNAVSEKIPVTQRTRMLTTGNIAASGNMVGDVDDVASLLSHIRKSAQEVAYTIAVDKAGTVLEIHKYSKGTFNSSQVNPVEVAGRILNIPDVAKAYFVHNHPSGNLMESESDRLSTNQLGKILALKDISLDSLVIGGTRYKQFNAGTIESRRYDPKNIAPQLKNKFLPVKERFLQKTKGHEKLPQISDSETATNFIRDNYQDKDGFLLLDMQNKPVDFIEYPKGEATKTAASDIIGKIEKANAAAIIVNSKVDVLSNVSRQKFIENLSNGLSGSIQIHDVINKGRSLDNEGLLFSFLRSKGNYSNPASEALNNLNVSEPLFKQSEGMPLFKKEAPESFSKPDIALVQKAMPYADVKQNDDGTINVTFKDGNGFTIDYIGKQEDGSVILETKYGNFYKPDTRKVAGAYLHNKKLVLLSETSDKSVFDHEFTHFLERSGYLKRDDIGALNMELKKIGIRISEEGRADLISNMIKKRDSIKNAPLKRVLQKIQDFIDMIRNLIGSRTALGVVRDIESGKVIGSNVSKNTGMHNNEVAYSIEKTKEAEDYFENGEYQKDHVSILKGMFKNWNKGNIPGKTDLSVLAKWIKSPDFSFEKIPALWRVYESGLDRVDATERYYNGFTETHEGKGLLTDTLKFQKDRLQEYEKLKKLLIDNDANKIVVAPVKWNKFEGTYDEYLDSAMDNLKEMGFSDQAIVAWKAYRKMAFNALEEQMKQYREQYAKMKKAGLPPPQITTIVDGKEIEVSLKTAESIMGQMADYYYPRMRQSGNYTIFAKKEGVNPERINMDDIDIPGVGPVRVNKKAEELRQQGYKVTFEKSKSLPEDVYETSKRTISLQAILQQSINNTLKNLKKNLGLHFTESTTKDGKPELILTGDYNEQYNDVFKKHGGRFHSKEKDGKEAWHFKEPKKNLKKTILSDLHAEVNNDIIEKAMSEFAYQVTMDTANVERARGFRAHMIKRGESTGIDVWKGYEEDPNKAFASYLHSLSGGLAKRDNAIEMTRAMTGTDISWQDFKKDNEGADYKDYLTMVNERRIDPATQKNAYSAGMAYMGEMLRNQEFADRAIGVLKGLAVIKYLGGRVIASSAVNLTALVTAVPASMNTYAGIPLHNSIGALGKGLNAMRTYWNAIKTGKEDSLGADLKWCMDEIYRNGWDNPQVNKEALGVLRSKIGGAWAKTIEYSMWVFGQTEKLNRVSTIAGTFLELKAMANGKGEVFNKDAAIKKAKKVSDRAHGTYGKVAYPMIAQGKGLTAHLARSFYMFSKYSHTYLQNMYDMGVKYHNYKSLAYMAVAPTVLAGLGAFPLSNVVGIALKAMLKGLTDDDDPEESFYQWAEKNLGIFGNVPRQGISGMFGVDIRGSLAISVDPPTNIIELLGAPGSVLTDIYDSSGAFIRGDFTRGLEKALPRAAGTIIQAAREGSGGVTTKRNAPLWHGDEQIKPSGYDTLLRIMSLNPAHTQKLKDKNYSEKQVDNYYKDWRAEINSKVRAFASKPTKERTKGNWLSIYEEIQEYNLQAHNRKADVPLVTSKTINMMLKKQSKPPSKKKPSANNVKMLSLRESIRNEREKSKNYMYR